MAFMGNPKPRNGVEDIKRVETLKFRTDCKAPLQSIYTDLENTITSENPSTRALLFPQARSPETNPSNSELRGDIPGLKFHFRGFLEAVNMSKNVSIALKHRIIILSSGPSHRRYL
ncbi:hypothetical protein [Thermococcus sp.]|uniref:hypothetical protein n=1 Tax=Thermococcus sp. TaxID=35749 RepID=UPI0026152B52|nr:hypothetical protein [Thermococcus sp.]